MPRDCQVLKLALYDGAKLANECNDPGAAHYYYQCAEDIPPSKMKMEVALCLGISENLEDSAARLNAKTIAKEIALSDSTTVTYHGTKLHITVSITGRVPHTEDTPRGI
jgi:hypothetical protein